MRSTLGVFAFGLAACVAAHEHNHQHFHERGAPAAASESCEVQYFTSTSYGEWGLVPGTSTSSVSSSTSTPPPPPPSTTSSAAAVPTSTSSSSPPPPPPTTTSSTSTSTSTPTPQPETTTAPIVAPQVQYKAQVSTTEAAPAPAPTSEAKAWGDQGYIAPNGNKWAFCYTPYTSDGQCKSADQVSSDLKGLKGKGFTSIRTYANDCNGVVNIGAGARAHGLKIILGINIDGSGVGGAYSQVDGIAAWGKGNWDMVEMVVVGNEAIFAGFCSASELVGLIGTVKSKFKSAGYSGPVTTTEPLGTIQQYGSTICPAVDVIGANIHPYFNNAVSALLAGPFVAKQLEDLAAVCNHQKEAYCLETGWPTGGSSNGIAVPGFDAQKIAITGIMAAIGSKAAVFSFEDDHWKAPGPYGVEQKWGCSGLF